jgi:hypothetical protein
MIEIRYWLVCVSYWIRPYDICLDARRWRWQRRGCWRASRAGRDWQGKLQRLLGARDG